MTITAFDLKLANFIQDKGSIDLNLCTSLFNKSESSLKRNIYKLNEYLSEDLHFSINNHHVKTNMTYEDFSKLCEGIQLKDYSISLNERIILFICLLYFF